MYRPHGPNILYCGPNFEFNTCGRGSGTLSCTGGICIFDIKVDRGTSTEVSGGQRRLLVLKLHCRLGNCPVPSEGRAECVKDLPVPGGSLQDWKPGLYYGVDDQCRIAFGSTARACSFTNHDLVSAVAA